MSKKTETIEVRVSPELKSELSEMSKSRREAMSQTIRVLIRKELSSAALNSSNAKVGNMTKSGTQRLREAGLAGITLVSLAIVWNLAQQTPVSAQATVRATFAQMDRDDNGIITREEFDIFAAGPTIATEGVIVGGVEMPEACKDSLPTGPTISHGDAEPDIAAEFTKFDGDQDGKIIFEEVQTRLHQEMTAQFTKSDANDDGFLTRDEFSSQHSNVVVEGPAGLSPDCLEALELSLPPLPTDGPFVPDLKVVFAMIDENRDGKVSKSEFLNQ